MPTTKKMMTLAALLVGSLLAWALPAAAGESSPVPTALERAIPAASPLPASEAALDAELQTLLRGTRGSDLSVMCPAWMVCFTSFQCGGVCLNTGICLANCCHCS